MKYLNDLFIGLKNSIGYVNNGIDSEAYLKKLLFDSRHYVLLDTKAYIGEQCDANRGENVFNSHDDLSNMLKEVSVPFPTITIEEADQQIYQMTEAFTIKNDAGDVVGVEKYTIAIYAAIIDEKSPGVLAAHMACRIIPLPTDFNVENESLNDLHNSPSFRRFVDSGRVLRSDLDIKVVSACIDSYNRSDICKKYDATTEDRRGRALAESAAISLLRFFTEFISKSDVGVCDSNRRIKFKGREGKVLKKVKRVVYAGRNIKKDQDKYIELNKIDWKHSWEVSGHWRNIGEGKIGKDRCDEYCVKGHTWVRNHTRGDGELVKKTRLVA